jgi:uncharacterized membrane protein
MFAFTFVNIHCLLVNIMLLQQSVLESFLSTCFFCVLFRCFVVSMPAAAASTTRYASEHGFTRGTLQRLPDAGNVLQLVLRSSAVGSAIAMASSCLTTGLQVATLVKQLELWH